MVEVYSVLVKVPPKRQLLAPAKEPLLQHHYFALDLAKMAFETFGE